MARLAKSLKNIMNRLKGMTYYEKIIFAFMSAMLIFGATACGNGQQAQNTSAPTVAATAQASSDAATSTDTEELTSATATSEEAEAATSDVILEATTEQTNSGKTLVVYFSVPETTQAENMTQEEENSAVVIDGEVLGNTQYIAQLIQEDTGAEIFRVEPETSYTTKHDDLVALATEEKSSNARPQLLKNIENIDDYDVIFVGYPIWWGDMPMIMYTFFESNDLSGKTIVPFSTNGGSGLANTVQTITELNPNSAVEQNAFTVSRNDVENSKDSVLEWVQSLDLEQ